jgi:integrase
MSKPKKVVLKDGSVAWEVYVRDSGRGSKQIRRRFSNSKSANEFLEFYLEEKKKLRGETVKVGSFYDTTFASESEQWLDNLVLRSSPGHYRRCKEVVEDFNKTFGSLEPNKITAEFLTSLQRKLKHRTGSRKKTAWSNSTVNRYTEAICAVLNFSAFQKRIPFNPVSGFKKLPRGSTEMLFWEEREASSFLHWASLKYTNLDNRHRKARKNYIAYLMALNTGMRAGEIWGLKPHDLSFNEEGVGDTLFVRRQLNRMTREFAPLKGGVSGDKDKSRHVPCSSELRKELEALLAFNGSRGDGTVFQNAAGGTVDHDSFAQKFERDVKRWGGRRIRFHDLRHTAATLMLSKGVDVKTVSEILGHEDISTTMIYVHLLGDKIKQVSKSFCIQPQAEKPRLFAVSNH